MFTEQTTLIRTYDILIDSEFHADGRMEPKNWPQALTRCYLVNNTMAEIQPFSMRNFMGNCKKVKK